MSVITLKNGLCSSLKIKVSPCQDTFEFKIHISIQFFLDIKLHTCYQKGFSIQYRKNCFLGMHLRCFMLCKTQPGNTNQKLIGVEERARDEIDNKMSFSANETVTHLISKIRACYY